MAEYTPSDEQVRDDYSEIEEGTSPHRQAAFDRWLADHDARVVREAEQARSDANWALYIDRQGGA